MSKQKFEVEGFRCDRCGHGWLPRRGEAPKVCPKCKSRAWDSGGTVVEQMVERVNVELERPDMQARGAAGRKVLEEEAPVRELKVERDEDNF